MHLHQRNAERTTVCPSGRGAHASAVEYVDRISSVARVPTPFADHYRPITTRKRKKVLRLQLSCMGSGVDGQVTKTLRSLATDDVEGDVVVREKFMRVADMIL